MTLWCATMLSETFSWVVHFSKRYVHLLRRHSGDVLRRFHGDT